MSSARIGVACVVNGSRRIARGDMYVMFMRRRMGALGALIRIAFQTNLILRQAFIIELLLLPWQKTLMYCR